MNTPHGAWPVMLTPFHDDRSIDLDTLDGYTDWLIEQGSAGLFPVALSGEMYELTEAERIEVARRVVARAAGRVPVVAASITTGTAREQADAAQRLAKSGVDQVVLVTPLLAPAGVPETDATDIALDIAHLAPEIDFGIYECPLPFARTLSTASVARLAESGRFGFFKETTGRIDVIAERVAAASGTPLEVFAAAPGITQQVIAAGGAGVSGWAVNAYPDLAARVASGADDARLDEAQRLLTVAEKVVGPAYPNSAKLLVAHRSGLAFAPVSRWRHEGVDPAALIAFDDLAVSTGLL
ncbi:dihydrodipicolinate synthase family protein [Agromyces atrinae]|nr:dihydrodipicolinate synthase family protein [Agromyces atrinae]NYD67585.1 4-hydroxy-tetrahydrodipicolinate synthase [Agromyces atrinae]